MIKKDILNWLTNVKSISVKPTSYDRLMITYKAFIKHSIAERETGAITSLDVQDYINSLVEEGYAASTIKKLFNLISGYLKYANAEGIINRVVTNNVKLPTQEAVLKKKRDIQVYSSDEEARLRKAAIERGDSFGFAVILMLDEGLRVGEVLALRKSDFNLSRRSLSISRTAIRLNERGQYLIQDSTKSFCGKRIIPLSSDVINHFDMLNINNDLIYSDKTYESFRFSFDRLCKKANVQNKAFHALRHTFATNCYYRGADVKVLSKILGHSDVNVTYNQYIHLFGDSLADMMKVIM